MNGPNYLPAFANPVLSRLQCTALSSEAKSNLTNKTHNPSSSAAIRQLASSTLSAPKVELKNKVLETPAKKVQPESEKNATLRQRSTHQCHPADAFLYTASEQFPHPIPLVFPADRSMFDQALVSIGPNSDAVLDRFNLGDDLLPRLCNLIGTVWSSRWEAVLRSSPWSLSYEEAENLSATLCADLKGTEFSITTVFFFSF